MSTITAAVFPDTGRISYQETALKMMTFANVFARTIAQLNPALEEYAPIVDVKIYLNYKDATAPIAGVIELNVPSSPSFYERYKVTLQAHDNGFISCQYCGCELPLPSAPSVVYTDSIDDPVLVAHRVFYGTQC